MTTRRRHPNFLWVAFLAIVGMVSAGESAKACAEVKVAKACCKASPAANCHCCESSGPYSGAARAQGVVRLVPTASVRFDAPSQGIACECRVNAPAAPAQKSDSRTSHDRRTQQGHNEVIAYLGYAPRPFMPTFSLVSVNVSPPRFPLYLRTLHLLV